MARKLQIKFSNKSPNEPPDKSSSKSFNQLSNQSFNEPHKLSQELEVFNTIDGYLCELKEAQIRDGLHILGQCPQGRQLRDLIVAIARHPDTHRLGLTRAIAEDFNLDFDPLMTNLAEELSPELTLLNQPCRTVGDGVAVIEDYAAALVEEVIQAAMQSAISVFLTPIPGPRTQQELTWIQAQLLPKLQQTNQEISNLLQGLA
ncbi:MAG: cobaltochelatase subunit CobN, partial [Oscillatoriales cyanobacterium RM1_1_9]|nr:cobaltochelatase subunit CobN [Oscillatoriales cyanobacterium RM1_1_9]